MSLGTPIAISASPGATQDSAPTVTLPTITKAGYAYVQIGINVTTSEVSAAPAGWSPLAGPINNGSNNQRVWLYGKALAPADSGAVIAWALTAGGRWDISGFFVPEADALGVATTFVDNTTDANLSVPGITPATDNALLAYTAYTRTASGDTQTTQPAGWTELIDRMTTNASGARFGGVAAYRQLSGQAGVAQPAITPTFSPNAARGIGFVFTVPQPPPRRRVYIKRGGALVPLLDPVIKTTP